MSRITLALKAARELSPQQLGQYAWFQMGLHSGYLRKSTQAALRKVRSYHQRFEFHPILKLPGQDALINALGSEGIAKLLEEADQIVSGQVRLFGADFVPLRLVSPEPLLNWTEYQNGGAGLENLADRIEDIKFIWEPARFGWAYTLARAYFISGNELYPQAFWNYTEQFLENNPPYNGLHWVSAQEVALRILCFTFALQVFRSAEESTDNRKAFLKESIAEHAARLPPTLSYARAQNNNHLLCEAVGLITAGMSLADHPLAGNWRRLGWRTLNAGLESQIAENGTYIQHSTNYHRLLLQIALWINALEPGNLESRKSTSGFSAQNRARLTAATRWLMTLLDLDSGSVPNLGPNDGAYILPLTICPFHDFRPVLQAAACTFLKEWLFSAGAWDEMNLWIGNPGLKNAIQQTSHTLFPLPHITENAPPHVVHNTSEHSWAYLRVAHFTDRPGHADQLHLDLWWRGHNIAKDAGTYLYNASPPWDNALAHTDVHNTLTINGCDQMNRAGRFLYLDWAQSHLLQHEHNQKEGWERITAQHIGYNRLGVTHRRSVTALQNSGWLVEDSLLVSDQHTASKNSPFSACLHWLLPDWEWALNESSPELPSNQQEVDRCILTLRLNSPHGWITLHVRGSLDTQPGIPPDHLTGPGLDRFEVQLVRAGKVVFGKGPASETWGWSSPTYSVKIPALSLRVATISPLPISFSSLWEFLEQ